MRDYSSGTTTSGPVCIFVMVKKMRTMYNIRLSGINQAFFWGGGGEGGREGLLVRQEHCFTSGALKLPNAHLRSSQCDGIISTTELVSVGIHSMRPSESAVSQCL